jgi:hypothetical protein
VSEFFVESNIDEWLARWKLVAEEVPEVLDDVATEMGKEAIRLLRGVTRTWRRKPTFDVLTEVRGGDIVLLVGTDSQVFHWVDKGTRPHVIRARNAPRLRFNSAFVPKTTPGSLQSSAGKSGPPVVFALQVMHPGTAPRKFSEKVMKSVSAKAQPLLSQRIKKWLRR